MTESPFQIVRLSLGSQEPKWVIAVFAHNEARDIEAVLQSIQSAAAGAAIDIFVLSNGCLDDTHSRVSRCSASVPNLWLVDISVGDKVNAWNLFVHHVLPRRRFGQIEKFSFMDGDCVAAPSAITWLARALGENSNALAAGAMPLDMQQLYRFGPLPSRTQWVGVYTPLRWVAMQWIRRFRK